MAEIFSIHRDAVQPLIQGPDGAAASYRRVAEFCRRAWGDDGRPQLFAEPRGENDYRSWHVSSTGPAYGYYELDEASRDNLKARLGRRIGDLRRALAKLADDEPRQAQELSHLLQAALQIPGWQFLFAVDGEPVLAGWGHADAASAGARIRLLPIDDAIVVPAAIARPVGMWLALAVLASILLAATAAASRWLPLGWLPFDVATASCQVDPRDRAAIADLDREIATADNYRRQLAALQLALMQNRAQCPIQTVELPRFEPPPAPKPEPRDAEADRDRAKAKQRGARDGKLQFVLAWDSVADLDLYVQCPTGASVGARNQSGCGSGRLDLDANGYGNPGGLVLMRDPVEQISWTGDAPAGLYRVHIHTFPARAGQPTDRANYRLSVFFDGKLISSKRGGVAYRGEPIGHTVDDVLSIRVPPERQ